MTVLDNNTIVIRGRYYEVCYYNVFVWREVPCYGEEKSGEFCVSILTTWDYVVNYPLVRRIKLSGAMPKEPRWI